MDKKQVKTLIEGDSKLQWWAAVLFAEVCETVGMEKTEYTKPDILYSIIKRKTEEWEQIVINRMTEIAEKGETESESLEKRVEKVEKQLDDLLRNHTSNTQEMEVMD